MATEYKLSLGLQNEDQLPPAVAAEFEQLIASIQQQFTSQLSAIAANYDSQLDPPGASLTLPVGGQSIVSGAGIVYLNWGLVNTTPGSGLATQYWRSPESMFSLLDPTKFTVRATGTYVINWSVTFAATNNIGGRTVQVAWSNPSGAGLTLWTGVQQGDGSVGNVLVGTMLLRDLKIGDFIKVGVSHTAGVNVLINDGYPTFLQVVKVAGL